MNRYNTIFSIFRSLIMFSRLLSWLSTLPYLIIVRFDSLYWVKWISMLVPEYTDLWIYKSFKNIPNDLSIVHPKISLSVVCDVISDSFTSLEPKNLNKIVPMKNVFCQCSLLMTILLIVGVQNVFKYLKQLLKIWKCYIRLVNFEIGSEPKISF